MSYLNFSAIVDYEVHPKQKRQNEASAADSNARTCTWRNKVEKFKRRLFPTAGKNGWGKAKVEAGWQIGWKKRSWFLLRRQTNSGH